MKTRSEELLTNLSERSFLSLWTIANPFRRSGNASVPNKEVCDLLVLFENDCVIFSDKHIKLKDDVDVEVAWNRWYRKAVVESVKQLVGARGHISTTPDNLYLDANCTMPLPAAIEDVSRIRFHLIAVVRGAAASCAKYRSNRGSLSLKQGSEGALPVFTVPQSHPGAPFVHIWDEVALDILMQNLDTVVDLIEYLVERESWLIKNPEFVFGGEEQALASYLIDLDGGPMYDHIATSRFDSQAVQSDLWSCVEQKAKAHAELYYEESKQWDNFIETSTAKSVYGLRAPSEMRSDPNSELTLRNLAYTSRSERRDYTWEIKKLLYKAELADPLSTFTLSVPPDREGASGFVFIVMKGDRDLLTAEQYLQIRMIMIQLQMAKFAQRFPWVERITAIALGSTDDPTAVEYGIMQQGLTNDEISDLIKECQNRIRPLWPSSQIGESSRGIDEVPRTRLG